MAELLSRPLLRRDEPAWGSRVPWFAAFCGAAWALIAGLALCVLPAMVVWLASGAQGGTAQPLQTGAHVWLLGLGAEVSIDGVPYSLVPLGLTLLVFVLALRAGRWAGHSAGVETMRRAVVVIVSMSATYVVGAGVVAGLATGTDIDVVPLEAMAWSGLWCGLAATIGVTRNTGVTDHWFERLSPSFLVSSSAAAGALGTLAAGSSLLVAVSLVVQSDRMGALIGGLEAGVIGTGVLGVLSAVYLPTMIVWAGSFALGPGFAVGAETSVAPAGVELGLVPALPVFAAMPTGDVGVAGWLTLVVPVASGVVAGTLVVRRSPGLARMQRCVRAGGAAAVAAVGMAVAGALASGSLGAARMAEIGPVPWQLAAATMVLVGVPAVLTAALWNGKGTDHRETATEEP